jgi:5-methylcytosine-specific restriction endonuclease McrA
MAPPFSNLNRPVRLRASRHSAWQGRPRPASAIDSVPVPTDTRLFVWQRDGGRCRACGSQRQLQFDHVIPRSWGGSDDVANVQLLCSPCNLRKGASLVDP